MKPTLKRVFKGIAYTFALLGSAVGGFPPPRPFAREQLPEEVIERVLDDATLDGIDGVESRWGLRIDFETRRPHSHLRTPES